MPCGTSLMTGSTLSDVAQVHVLISTKFMQISHLQTWGELIVNANALLMHYFFQIIQGND